jgi:sec-independent protein translocase protein TatA
LSARFAGGGTITVYFRFTKRAVCGNGWVHTEGRLTMARLGFAELMVIFAILVIIFGANRLPQLGRGIGSAIRNFKEGIKDEPEQKV